VSQGATPADLPVVGPPIVSRVLVVSADPEIHSTIARALELYASDETQVVRLFHAETASDALALATAQSPRIAFVDVTLGQGAGIGLVHFLPASVAGLVVVAIVPEGANGDVRLVEQAASLGASWVLLGELTGDDVLRAFGRVSPGSLSTPPPRFATQPPLAEPPETRRALAISDTRTLVDLDATLGALASSLPRADPRVPLCHELRAALERCTADERVRRATLQDPSTSAYSFAYFVDLAGREIDLARRHGRRFALATIELAPGALDPRTAVEVVLGAVRDTDVVARAEEHELLLLLPETGTKGARTLRRRVIERIHTHARRNLEKPPLRMGIAGFPWDGEDLSRLLRVARRRAERWSQWDTPSATQALLQRAVDALARGILPDAIGPLCPIDVPLREAWSIFDTLVRESTRAGDATIALHAPHDASVETVGLGPSVRAAALEAIGAADSRGADAFGPTSAQRSSRRDGVPSERAAPREGRDVLSVVTGVSRLADGRFAGLEVAALLCEHASYGIVGRTVEGRLLALHGYDLPFAEALLGTLDQPTYRRGAVADGSTSPSSPISRARSDPAGLRR